MNESQADDCANRTHPDTGWADRDRALSDIALPLAYRLQLEAMVFAGCGEGIMITDANTIILHVNTAFNRTTGYGYDEAVGQTPRLLNSGVQKPEFYEQLWQALRSTGYWQGEIWNRRKNGEVYAEWLGISAIKNASGEITHYIAIFSDITERKAAADRLAFLAHHDPLTGLPNRTLLLDRLEQSLSAARRRGTKAAVIYLDMDRFKQVNDTLGHALGDELLRQVAARMKEALREEDTISRIGGDEFIILPAQIRGPDDVARVAGKVFAVLQPPFEIGDRLLQMTFSAGISLFPDDAEATETLITHADMAMYHAKGRGRNNFQFFGTEMNQRAFQRLRIEQDLRQAIQRGELFLHFQPQMHLVTNRVIGIEALIRWHHPIEGILHPQRFLPIAEESGLMLPIGEWVLGEVCRVIRSWKDQGIPLVPVAVNISASQFRRGNLPELVQHALEEARLGPEWLAIELAESVLMHNPEHSLPMLQELKRMGVRLALDDFGTASSSLNYLQRLPIHTLKIDQSFVDRLDTNPDDAAIVTMAIRIAESLHRCIAAEGIERQESLNFLLRNGCTMGQGYLFHPPLPEAQLTALLRDTLGEPKILVSG